MIEPTVTHRDIAYVPGTRRRIGLGPLRLSMPSGRPHLTLASQFLLASLLMLAVGGSIVGWLIGQVIESSALNRTTSAAALYVESFVEPELKSLATQSRLEPAEVTALQGLLTDTPLGQRIVSFRIWSPDGEVLYSPNQALIGRRFGVDEGLAQALTGALAGDISDLSGPENVYERARWSHLIEMYLPVRVAGGSRIIAVTEFYELPDELEAEVTRDRLAAWAMIGASLLLAYIVLARIVHRGSDRIERQGAELRQRVGELSDLLTQNATLHERVRQAAARSTALTERERRRISSDLHDGPGQTVGFALLRLDSIEKRLPPGGPPDPEVTAMRAALRDALAEMRTIAAGLRMPDIDVASPEEVIRLAVADHELRTGLTVNTDVEELPADVPVATKIAIFRVVQEALSNAARHASGHDSEVRARAEGPWLVVAISDSGPGFDPTSVPADGHLGLAGMRERVELLGGQFEVRSSPDGSVVTARLPVAAGDRA